MVNPNLNIVFGPSPDAYFITYGRKFSHSKMPVSLTKSASEHPEMHPMKMAWIRLHPNGVTWIARNMYNGTIWWDSSIPANVKAMVEDANGAGKATYFSWTADGAGYFVKMRNSTAWELDVPDGYPLQINDLRRQFKDFDAGIKAIIFGQGGTHVYVFEAGFVAHFAGPEAHWTNHPLPKVFQEFSEPGWLLLEGSSLCPYNDQYYCLKFQKQGSNVVQMRWRLPPAMDRGLKEVMAITNTPAEQAELQRFESQNTQSGAIDGVGNFILARHLQWSYLGY